MFSTARALIVSFFKRFGLKCVVGCMLVLRARITATPSADTLGYFDQNLVMEYSHQRAIADGVNVGYDVYYIETVITKNGSKIPRGYNNWYR